MDLDLRQGNHSCNGGSDYFQIRGILKYVILLLISQSSSHFNMRESTMRIDLRGFMSQAVLRVAVLGQ